MGTNFPGYRNPKRLVAILIFIILKINIFSYEMEILPEILISGRVITLKVDTGIKEGDFIEIEDVEFPEDLILISKPTLRIYYGKIDGKNARLYQVNWALRSRKSGVFELPEIKITGKDSEINIDKKIIKVFEADESENNYPLIVNWSKNIDSEIYVGESLPIIIEAYNLEEINFPDKVVLTPPRKGEIVEVSGLGEINPERIGDDDLYRVSIASWIYTPFDAGRVVIPSVRVDINGLTRYTDPLEINILPLPEVNATGGVGEFMITTELTSTQVTPEDQFHFKVRIAGQGNIPYIEFPQIDYSGLILINKNETSSIEYSDEGFLGWKQIDYTLQALEPGVKEISVDEVSWIDKNGNDVFYNGSISHLNVVSVKVIEEDILPFLSFMKAPEIISSYRLFLYKTPVFWLFLLFSTFITLVIKIFGLIRKDKHKKSLLISVVSISLLLMSVVLAKGFEFQDELSIADSLIDNGEFLQALELYDTLEKNLSYNYGLYVNKALLWDKLQNKSLAVYNIRIAERLANGNTKIKDIKNYLSGNEESRLKQAKTANGINPDYIFIIFLIFFNIMITVVISLIKHKNISKFSMFFIVMLFTLLSLISLIFVDSRNRVKAGVISNANAPLTKVPNDKALDWLTLDEGNCVYIRGEWKNKFLIETEYGLQGWISKDSLLVLEER